VEVAERHVGERPGAGTAEPVVLLDDIFQVLGAAGFHGVSTRHPRHYLDWFCHGEQFRGSDGDARERTCRHECDGTYQTSRRDYVGMPIPFPRYWELAA